MDETDIPDGDRDETYRRIGEIVDDMYRQPHPPVEIQLISEKTRPNIPAELIQKIKFTSTHANIANNAKKYEINQLTEYLQPNEAKNLIKALVEGQSWFTITRENKLLEYIEY
jgi:hypothetical protein